MNPTVIRVELPFHLRRLAGIATVDTCVPVNTATVRGVLDALEMAYPMLRGTIRDQVTGERRPFLRFFACEQDLSMDGMDTELPASVADGREPLLVIGAIAGG